MLNLLGALVLLHTVTIGIALLISWIEDRPMKEALKTAAFGMYCFAVFASLIGLGIWLLLHA